MSASAAGVRSQSKNHFFRSLFKPRRKCHKINPALAAEAAPQTAMPLFQQTARTLGEGGPEGQRYDGIFRFVRRKNHAERFRYHNCPDLAPARLSSLPGRRMRARSIVGTRAQGL